MVYSSYPRDLVFLGTVARAPANPSRSQSQLQSLPKFGRQMRQNLPLHLPLDNPHSASLRSANPLLENRRLLPPQCRQPQLQRLRRRPLRLVAGGADLALTLLVDQRLSVQL